MASRLLLLSCVGETTRRVIAPIIVATLCAGAGCFDGDAVELPADFATCAEPAPTPPASTATLTYYQDAKPIVDARCAGCHVDGGIGPFALTTYDDLFRFLADVQVAVATDRMPPWKPADCCRDLAHDRSLTADEKAIVLAWIAQGALPGDPAAESPPLDIDVGGLSRVDLTIGMPEPFAPQPTIGLDEIRCFLIDWPVAETTYVTGINVRPRNRSIVHHVSAYIVDDDAASDLAERDGADGRPGWDCYGELGAKPDGWLGGWVPGTMGNDFPAGLGRKVPGGGKVLLNVHYDTASLSSEPDQMEIDLKLDDEVEREARQLGVGNPQWVLGDSMLVPAGEPDVMYNFKFDPTVVFGRGKPIDLFSANAHMHIYGSRASIAVFRKNGDVDCLLHFDDFDFSWNGDYFFAEPVRIYPGDELFVECHFDNSAANQRLVGGEQETPRDLVWHTDGEMCGGIIMMAEVE